MAVNRFLLQSAKNSIKSAFVPTQGGDPAAMGGMPPGGAPPMDPSMMGGMPPGGAPMDPSMMGGMPPGGAPPMDPSMMGGAPPMDPAMMGGAPPMDPAAAGASPPADPTEQIRTVVQEELQKALAGAKGTGKASKKNDNGQVELYMHRIQKLLTHLYSSLGLNLPHDILDDVSSPAKDGEDATSASSQDTSPIKSAKISVAEKAAGMMYLLRKKK
jgi:hypothetical protein